MSTNSNTKCAFSVRIDAVHLTCGRWGGYCQIHSVFVAKQAHNAR